MSLLWNAVNQIIVTPLGGVPSTDGKTSFDIIAQILGIWDRKPGIILEIDESSGQKNPKENQAAGGRYSEKNKNRCKKSENHGIMDAEK